MSNSFRLHETHKQLFSITVLGHGVIQGLGIRRQKLTAFFNRAANIYGLVDEWK